MRVVRSGSRTGGGREPALEPGAQQAHPECTGRRARGADGPWDRRDRVDVIGLPDSVRACLFDLDGVLTQTATVHAAAWKEMFDGYLNERAARTKEEEFHPFDPVAEYAEDVDGKTRYDGVRSFLAARGIELPGASPATRQSLRPSAGWATARTRSSCG